MRFKTYRWWVSWWSDDASEGTIFIEAPLDPTLTSYLFPRVHTSVGGHLWLENKDGKQTGLYFPVSRTLGFRPNLQVNFVGTCEPSPAGGRL